MCSAHCVHHQLNSDEAVAWTALVRDGPPRTQQDPARRAARAGCDWLLMVDLTFRVAFVCLLRESRLYRIPGAERSNSDNADSGIPRWLA